MLIVSESLSINHGYVVRGMVFKYLIPMDSLTPAIFYHRWFSKARNCSELKKGYYQKPLIFPTQIVQHAHTLLLVQLVWLVIICIEMDFSIETKRIVKS